MFAKTVNTGGLAFNLILLLTVFLTLLSTAYLLVRRKYRLLKSKILACLALVAALSGLSALIYWTRWYQILFTAEFSPALWLVLLLLAWNFANIYNSVRLATQVLFALLVGFSLGTLASFALLYLNISGRVNFPNVINDAHIILSNLAVVAVGMIILAAFGLFTKPAKLAWKRASIAMALLGVVILGLTASWNSFALLVFALILLVILLTERKTVIYSLVVVGSVLILNLIALHTPFIQSRWQNLQVLPVADLATTYSVTKSAISDSNPFWGAGSRPFIQSFLQYQPVNNGTAALPQFMYAFSDIWQMVINFGLLMLIPLVLFAYYFIRRSTQNLDTHHIWLNKLVWMIGSLVIGALLFMHVSMQLWAVFAVAVAVCANFEAVDYWRIRGRGLIAKTLAILLSLSLLVYLGAYLISTFAGGFYGFAYQRLQIGNAASEQATLSRIEYVSRLNPYEDAYHMDLAKLYSSILVDNLNSRKTPAKVEELATPLNIIWQEATNAVMADPLNFLNWDTRLSVLDLSSKVAPNAANYSPLFNEAIGRLQALAPRDPSKMMLLAQFVGAYNHQLALNIAQTAFLANPNILALQFDYAKLLISIENKTEAQKILQGFLNNNSLSVQDRAEAKKLLDSITK
jgi:hypothetical protein